MPKYRTHGGLTRETAYLYDDEVGALEERAQKERCSKSEVMRRALRRYLGLEGGEDQGASSPQSCREPEALRVTERPANVNLCPGTGLLAQYVDGVLPPAESEHIAGHLVDCERCYAVYIGVVQFLPEAPLAAKKHRSPEVTAFWREAGLPLRAANGLAHAGITSWEGLAGTTLRKLRSRPGLGEISVEQIRKAAAAKGIRLPGGEDGD